MALEITDSNFDASINSNQPSIVDFYTQWCGPCKALAPTIDKLAAAYAGRAIIGKMDAEKNTAATKFGIRSVPTIIFFKNGREVHKLTGAQPYAVLEQKLKELL